MTREVDAESLAPLLDVARDGTDEDIRIAALDAATRFPLNEDAWHNCDELIHRLILDEPPGSAARRSTLELAVRVPLMSMRHALRDLACDPSEPDRDVVQASLARAADPSQIPALLEQAEAGNPEAFQRLAAMPLEDEHYTVQDIPPLPPDASSDIRFWRGLVLARLGDYAALDSYLQAPGAEPTLFWGSPWIAYDTVAAIRPVPAAMGEHLLQLLAQYADTEQTRIVQLTVWAATGVADAEGQSPFEKSEAAPRTTSPGPALSGRAEPMAEKIKRSVAEGNRKAQDLPDEAAASILIGNDILDGVPADVDTRDWPVADLALDQLQAERPALDKGQMAWLIARDEPDHLIREMSGLLTPDRPAGDRLYLLNMLADAADHQAGRGGSPMRGAGPAGGAPSGRGPLIDDIPSASMMAPRDGEPAMAAAPDESEWALEGGAGGSPWRGHDIPYEEAALGHVAPEGATAAPRSMAPTASDSMPQPVEDERRVHVKVLHNGERRHSFLAGADNVIRCWIGLPQPELANVATSDIPRVNIPPEGLPLTVELSWNGQSDRQEMLLPADRTARTRDVELHLQVPEGETEICAVIAFRYKGRIFEIVHVKGAVLAPGQAEDPQHNIKVEVQARLREVISLEDRIPVDACAVLQTITPASPDAEPVATLWVFGGNGANCCELKGTEVAMKWLNQDLFTTQKTLVRRKAAAPAASGEERLDHEDKEVLRLLRDMARHGSAIHKQLKSTTCKDPGERIQLLNLDDTGYIPLEFVYDRGYPIDEAKLCDGWLDALMSDSPHCPACSLHEPTARELTRMPTICPLGFWSLQKIIERRDPRLAMTDDGSAHPSVPTDQRRQLPLIDDTVFASSHQVEASDRQETWDALQHQFAHPALAEDWDEWLDALEASDRPLLILMPHHDAEAGLDYLEIGAKELPPLKGHLSRGQLDEIYINPHGNEPGPIVLLLGCQTGTSTEEGYVQLARRFQELRSSIVVGTLAQVLGRHAAPVAREFVTQLLAVDDPTMDFGTIMRRVRRRMMAKGYLMALCLVALGDAEWRLTPRPKPGQPAAGSP